MIKKRIHRPIGPPPADSLGGRLHTARMSRKLGSRELSLKAELTPSQVARIEHGYTQSPTMDTIVKLARALGVRVDWLATGAGPIDATLGAGVGPTSQS